jgi:hypothetical protein
MASCRGLETNLFFEGYESDKIIAGEIDKLCERCPVIKECYEFGTSNKLSGVFGGFYLSNGQIDRKRNNHKSRQEVVNMAGKIYD